MAEVKCVKCGLTAAALERAPFTGSLGEKIAQNVCQSCWKEWTDTQIKVINEYQLNLVDEKARNYLRDQMKIFLNLNSLP
jgi:Fe-S cluster biosynthesis and repair protein YggX